jgi:hypothetical protein
MAETPEGKVKRWLKTRVKVLFPGAYEYWPPGGMYGRIGTPDCFLLWRGIFIAIEVKAEGNVPTPPQLRTLKSIADAGGVAAVLTGRDEVKLVAIYKAAMAKLGGGENA